MGNKLNAKKIMNFSFMFLSVMIVSMYVVSAGVGLKWDREALVVDEGERTCFTYNVYNPWPDESFVEIEVSEELESVITYQESETKFIPAHTSSDKAIPVEFCFDVPFVYENQKDCLIGNFVCKQECEGEQKIYDGDVIVTEVPSPAGEGGVGGSAASAAVSAPLTIKVRCDSQARNYTPVYLLTALIVIIIILIFLINKYRKMHGSKTKVKHRKKR